MMSAPASSAFLARSIKSPMSFLLSAVALGGQFGLARVAARADLNAQFRLGLEAGFFHFFHQAQQTGRGQHDKAGGYFNHVKADLFGFFEVLIHGIRPVAHDGFNPAAG